jgi:hypothetical protein
MSLIEALAEEQATIIGRSLDENYPLEKCIADIDLIADLTELKIKLKR